MTDVGTTPRRGMSALQRLKIFERAKGICHLCEQRIQAGQKWDADHIIPLALGGSDGESYMAPAHKACHAQKTAVDLGQIAKAKRIKARHIGAHKPSGFRKPPPGYNPWTRRVER